MKYSYAIFDMDGLMFDTENLFVTSFETEVSRATGYRFEREQLKKLIGVNASRTRELFPQLFPAAPSAVTRHTPSAMSGCRTILTRTACRSSRGFASFWTF